MNNLHGTFVGAVVLAILNAFCGVKADSSTLPLPGSHVAAGAPSLVSAYLVPKGGQSGIVQGRTVQFIAYGIYSDGSVGALPDLQGNAVTAWNTTNHSVARISALGHVTAVSAGIVNIEAQIGLGKAASWAMTVTPASGPPAIILSCSANPAVIYQGGSTIITAAASSGPTTPFSYEYESSAGLISGTSTSETLETTAVGPGVINVTCNVDQPGTGAASATTNVILRPQTPGGQITVQSPVAGSTANFPVWLLAQNTGCNGFMPTSFGYSVDNSSAFVAAVTDAEIDAPDQTIDAGVHTVHFKSWTSHGECSGVDTTFTVTDAAGAGDALPSDAISSGDLDGARRWGWNHDPGTPGASTGLSLYPVSNLSTDAAAREFQVTYSGNAGEIYFLPFATDTVSTHFVYDTYIYLTGPWQIENIELDMNQVMQDGQTVILGTQCSNNSKTWEYTTVTGGPHWNPSNIACDPQLWAPDTWHHVQIASHRDDAGVATYDWVNLDGVQTSFWNASGDSALALGWPIGDLLLNFQLDGSGSGSITTAIDQLTIYRW